MNIRDFFKDKDVIKNLKDDFKELSSKNKVIPTGSFTIDKITGINGFPLGSIIHIAGEAASGKTTLCLNISNNVLSDKNNNDVIYVDSESSLSHNYLNKFIKKKKEKFWLVRPTSAENLFERLIQIVNNTKVSLIVIDSIAALIPESELKGSIHENSGIATLARILSRSLSLLKSLCFKNQTLLILVNQYRTKLNLLSSFGSSKTLPGGRALNYYVDLKLEMIRTSYIISKNRIIGSNISISCTKNKLGGVFGEKYIIPLIFERGFDVNIEIIQDAISKKIIQKKGSWYYYKDKPLGQGLISISEGLNKSFTLEEYKDIKYINNK